MGYTSDELGPTQYVIYKFDKHIQLLSYAKDGTKISPTMQDVGKPTMIHDTPENRRLSWKIHELALVFLQNH